MRGSYALPWTVTYRKKTAADSVTKVHYNPRWLNKYVGFNPDSSLSADTGNPIWGVLYNPLIPVPASSNGSR